jgi:hypothetical protein
MKPVPKYKFWKVKSKRYFITTSVFITIFTGRSDSRPETGKKETNHPTTKNSKLSIIDM